MLALPVTNIPASIPDVLAIGTSFLALAVIALVFLVNDPKLTATSVLEVASNPNIKLFMLRLALLVPIFTVLAELPSSRLVTLSL